MHQLYQKHELLNVEADPKEEDPFWKDDIYSVFSNLVITEVLKGVQVGEPARVASLPDKVIPLVIGSLPIHDEVRRMANEFREVFSRTVNPTPASAPPMKIELKEINDWFTAKNKQPPRMLSADKCSVLRQQIEVLVALGVLSRYHEATHYSQVLPVKKPHQDPSEPIQWRLCVDYRNLNSATKGFTWTIPNIRLMLQRIGTLKAKWFAVLDLTSGYHQVALDENSRALAAFITPFGAKSYIDGLNRGTCLLSIHHVREYSYWDDIFPMRNLYRRHYHLW